MEDAEAPTFEPQVVFVDRVVEVGHDAGDVDGYGLPTSAVTERHHDYQHSDD